MKMWQPRAMGLVTIPLVFAAGATFQASPVTLALASLIVVMCGAIIWNVTTISRNLGSIDANQKTLQRMRGY